MWRLEGLHGALLWSANASHSFTSNHSAGGNLDGAIDDKRLFLCVAKDPCNRHSCSSLMVPICGQSTITHLLNILYILTALCRQGLKKESEADKEGEKGRGNGEKNGLLI